MTELEALMNSLGQSPTHKELAKMFKLADADGSGDIDFVEFVTLMAHKMQDDKECNEEEMLKSAFSIFVCATLRLLPESIIRLRPSTSVNAPP